jgi:hypothetical protein
MDLFTPVAIQRTSILVNRQDLPFSGLCAAGNFDRLLNCADFPIKICSQILIWYIPLYPNCIPIVSPLSLHTLLVISMQLYIYILCCIPWYPITNPNLWHLTFAPHSCRGRCNSSAPSSPRRWSRRSRDTRPRCSGPDLGRRSWDMMGIPSG